MPRKGKAHTTRKRISDTGLSTIDEVTLHADDGGTLALTELGGRAPLTGGMFREFFQGKYVHLRPKS
jgi:hypothetical protein